MLPHLCFHKQTKVDSKINLSEIRELVQKLQLILDRYESGIPAAETPPGSAAADPSAGTIPPMEPPLLPGEDLSDWWDDSDLKIKLKISASTLQRRRKDGTLKPFCIGRRYYYLRQDILKIRHRFMK